MQTQSLQGRLNEQQLDMIRLFERPMPQSHYDELRRFVVNLLAKQLDEEMDRLEKENGWTAETYEQWGKEHMRSTAKK